MFVDDSRNGSNLHNHELAQRYQPDPADRLPHCHAPELRDCSCCALDLSRELCCIKEELCRLQDTVIPASLQVLQDAQKMSGRAEQSMEVIDITDGNTLTPITPPPAVPRANWILPRNLLGDFSDADPLAPIPVPRTVLSLR